MFYLKTDELISHLRTYKEDRHLSNKSLSKILGVHPNHVDKLLSGYNQIKRYTYNRILRVIETNNIVDPSKFLSDMEDISVTSKFSVRYLPSFTLYNPIQTRVFSIKIEGQIVDYLIVSDDTFNQPGKDELYHFQFRDSISSEAVSYKRLLSEIKDSLNSLYKKCF